MPVLRAVARRIAVERLVSGETCLLSRWKRGQYGILIYTEHAAAASRHPRVPGRHVVRRRCCDVNVDLEHAREWPKHMG
jgi:hypothetical protein